MGLLDGGSVYTYLERARDAQWKKDVERRLSDIEAHAFKNSRKTTTTKAQQILLLKELGFLDKILQLDISNKNKAKLLSILLNSSEENIKKDLQQINSKDSEMKNSINYKFLLETFNSIGLKDKIKSTEIELDNILKKEEIKRKKK